jgi:DNA-binding SARP family transcriptional activator/tetratricopeptide (TPR) repeat protein
VRDLRVRLLGELQVEGCDPSRFRRRQVRTLLKVLALNHDQPVGLDRLIDCLWGDEPPDRPADHMSVLASRLRSVLGAERVRRTDAGYALEIDWLDLDALREYAAESDSRLAAGAHGAARAAAAAGLSLVRGQLLADEADAGWAEIERSAADRLVAHLRQTAAAAAMAAGDWTGAAELANEVLLVDPFDELAVRVLMDALARSGRPASALATFAAARVRLAEELGVSPSAETEALHTSILLQEVPGPVRVDPAAAPDLEGLPGREAPMGDLDELLARAEQGRGQIVVVEGEAGIGKSRLLHEWSRRAAVRGARVVSVGCDELGRTLPLQPLLDAVSVLAGQEGPDTADEVVGPDIAVLGPLLGMPARPAGATRLTALTDPAAGQALLFAALFNVIRRQSERRPLVVVVDDVHLADAATVAWLGQAVRRLARCRVVIAASSRAEEAVSLPGAAVIPLGPLDLEAAVVIVGPDRAAALHERSGGHPLFLVELATADVDGGLPASIREAVSERCGRAGSAAGTLRAAAVIGPEVDLDVLSAVTGAAPGVLLDHLEEGVRRRLLVEEGPAFAFPHALVRESLASTVGASRTAYIHREAAKALDRRRGADPLAVARHSRLGGDLERASARLVTAARMAVARFDQAEALRLLDEAIVLDDSAEARLERARVYSMLARYGQAAEDLRAAQAGGAGPEAWEVAGWLAHFERRFPEALTLADRGAREADDDELRRNCLALGGWVSLAAGHLEGAESRLQGALGIGPAVGQGDGLGGGPEAGSRLAGAWLAWLRMSQGRPEQALRLVGAGRDGGLAAYRFPNAYQQMAVAMAQGMVGRADEALSTVEALRVEVSRMGARRWAPRPLNLRGWILRNLGATAEADDLNQAAIEDSRDQGLAEPLANGLLDLASGRLIDGEIDAARAFLDEATDLGRSEHAFRWRHQMRARLIRARLELALGENDAALAAARSLATDAATIGAPRYEVQARLVAATAAHRTEAAADADEVGRLLAGLDTVAGLESWWITAETAREFKVDAWAALSRQRVARLARHAGRYSAALQSSASHRFG